VSIELNKIQIANTNSSNNHPQIVPFCGTTSPTPNDTFKLSSKEKGISNGTKIAIVLGTIGTIVGGIFLHKHFSAKSTTENIQRATTELSQAVKNLIAQGRITQKEAEMFNEIHNLEGEEFVTKAYELIAKSMNLEKFPKLNISHEMLGDIDGHAGKEITIYLDNAIRLYGKDGAKSNIIDLLRHELEHYKQDIIIFLQKGDKTYEIAFAKQKGKYIVDKALFKGVKLEEVLNEEAAKYGYTPNDVNELYKIMFEHDTPIETIRQMTPCDFEKLHLKPEELTKADEYLEGVKNYMTQDRFPKNFFLPNGHYNIEQVRASGYIERFAELQEMYLGTGYVNNPLEIGARQAGESLRDKFIAFLEAISNR